MKCKNPECLDDLDPRFSFCPNCGQKLNNKDSTELNSQVPVEVTNSNVSNPPSSEVTTSSTETEVNNTDGSNSPPSDVTISSDGTEDTNTDGSNSPPSVVTTSSVETEVNNTDGSNSPSSQVTTNSAERAVTDPGVSIPPSPEVTARFVETEVTYSDVSNPPSSQVTTNSAERAVTDPGVSIPPSPEVTARSVETEVTNSDLSITPSPEVAVETEVTNSDVPNPPSSQFTTNSAERAVTDPGVSIPPSPEVTASSVETEVTNSDVSNPPSSQVTTNAAERAVTDPGVSIPPSPEVTARSVETEVTNSDVSNPPSSQVTTNSTERAVTNSGISIPPSSEVNASSITKEDANPDVSTPPLSDITASSVETDETNPGISISPDIITSSNELQQDTNDAPNNEETSSSGTSSNVKETRATETDGSTPENNTRKHVDHKEHAETNTEHAASGTELAIKVIFHVLVSKNVNLDPKKGHGVCIACEPLELGGFDSTKHKMTMQIIKGKHGCFEYEMEMLIPKKYEEDGFRYTYVICRTSELEFENEKHGYRNFKIPQDLKKEIKGNWHQYDGFYCQKKQQNSWLMSGFRRKKNTSELDKAFKYFVSPVLTQALKLVKDEDVILLEELDEKVLMILHMVDNDIASCKEHIDNLIIKRLTEHLQKSSNTATNNMPVMLTLLAMKLTKKYKITLTQKQRQVIYQCLFVAVDRKAKKCPTLDIIQKCHDKKVIAQSILEFIVSRANDEADSSWLLAVPLYHFLNGNSQPFIKPELTNQHTTSEWWCDKDLDRRKDQLKKRTWNPSAGEILNKISALFEADYLLPRIFVAALRTDHALNVIKTGLIPPEICCANLYYHLHNISYWVHINTTFFIECFSVTAKKIEESFTSTKGENVLKDLLALLTIVQDLFKVVVNSYANDLKYACLEITFAVCDCVMSVGSQMSRHKDTKAQTIDSFREMTNSLCNLYRQELYNIIRSGLGTSLLKKINQLLRLKTSPDLQPIRDELIAGLMSEIIEKLSDDECFDIYDSEDSYSGKIQDMLIDKATKVLDRQLRNEVNMAQYFTTPRQSLISKLWERFWNDYENDRFHMFEWKPLILFLGQLYNCGDQTRAESQSLILCQEQFVQIVSLLEEYHRRIEQGEITKKEMEMILEKRDVSCPLIMFPCKDSQMDFIFQQRQIELNFYEDHLEYVQSLLHICSLCKALCNTQEYIKLKSALQDFAQGDSEKKLTDIYDIPDYLLIDHYIPNINPFKIPEAILDLLPKLHNLAKSQLFVEIWKNAETSCRKLTTDTFFAVIGEIWIHAIESWGAFKVGLETGDISVECMEKHIQVFEERYDEIENELMLVLENYNIVKERIGQLKQYRIMNSGQKVSNELLAIRNILGLTDSFEVCLQITRLGYDNKTLLKEINPTGLDVGIMKNIKQNEIRCLEEFRKAEPMIKWLKETMKEGLKELKVFIELALMSADGGALATDKVNFFHAVTSAFAPLIFDLKQDSSFDEVMKKCDLVWKELQNDENLPRKLSDTNKELEWFKAVRQSHGSVEVTTLKQAEQIIAHGIYGIGIPADNKNKTELEISKVLTLLVPQLRERKDFGSDIYTYNKLMDLQSRLMLVGGQAEKGNENIESFTAVLDGVVRLSKSFVKLCKDGCVFFDSWKVRFLCSDSEATCAFLTFGKDQIIEGQRNPDDVVEYIRQLANCLERYHGDWLKYLNKNREEYLELNYYTLEQLVFLQQEIIKIGREETDPRIYPILSLVKQDCSRNDLIKAMEAAMATVDKFSIPKTSEEKEEEEFIQYILDSGFTPDLAKKAYHNVSNKLDKDEGLMYCINHEHDEFTGWTTEGETIEDNIAETLTMMPNSDRVTCKDLIAKFDDLWKEFLRKVSFSLLKYLSLEHLGIILHNLSQTNGLNIKRNLAPGLKPGVPNLIVCPEDDMLNCLTYMYMHPVDQVLPRPDEVLICTKDTKYDEVNIFLRRALYNSVDKLYCLAFADFLEYSIAEKVERTLLECSEENKDKLFQLVILCTQENELKKRLVGALEKYRRPLPALCTPTKIAKYLSERLVCQDETSASAVDFSRSSVRVIQSRRAGVGKSLYVRRLVEKLRKRHPVKQDTSLTIRLYEKDVDISHIVDKLMTRQHSPGETNPVIFHLDISSEVLNGVDFLLYNLLILGCIKDKDGHVWIKSPSDLYVIEHIPCRYNLADSKIRKSVHRIFGILPKVNCWSPLDTLTILQGNEFKDYHDKDSLFDEIEFKSEVFQRPFQCLSKLANGESLNTINVNEPKGTKVECLDILLRHCGIQDPSWAEIHYFVRFLNTQLKDFETSSFCSPAAAAELPGFSKFVLQFSIEMSKDFATRSLYMSEESPLTNETNTDGNLDDTADIISQFQLKRRWESSPHPYIFFNPDHHSMTFLGFNIDRHSGNLIDQQTGRILKKNLVSRLLYYHLSKNGVNLNENFNNLKRVDRMSKLCSVMGIDACSDPDFDPDPSYELTPDNAKKILAIYMRFRCNIPVIIMGETGCGKTRLIKFMCDLQRPVGTQINNMILMKIHGGTTSQNITEKVTEAAALANENSKEYGPDFYTVLFFDEANTTEAIGLIKEIMCDGTINGEMLNVKRNLKIVAACNPYRKHTDDMIKRLENAGLGYHVDADATPDKLGRVPMRRLVYRVQPLPSSMLPLVWDFGQLNVDIEELYIQQMVKRAIEEEKLPNIYKLGNSLSKVLIACQEFMREQKNECSFVSLRDVERVITVMSWFHTHGDLLHKIRIKLTEGEDDDEDENKVVDDEDDEDVDEDESGCNVWNDGDDDFPLNLTDVVEDDESNDINDATLSLILALAVCYRAGLRCREEFDETIIKHFTGPCSVPGGLKQFQSVIERCQEIFLEDVELGINIAKNQALKENVFLMVVCIELRIPLFLVGKPGSSKSLAKAIVADVMQGNSSRSEFFKHFKQTLMMSFQCSPLSTAEGIVSTFKQSANIQKDKKLDTFVATVVLDEIGLAEDSSRMPLKTLHPLLEDGCEANEVREPHKKVSFVGISNWALDPAKMNRGISVQREVPETKELMDTAEGICQSSPKVHSLIKPVLKSLTKSYLEVFEEARQEREFFGLRDFYSLVKMVYSFAENNTETPCWHQLEHCIRRNFGGLDSIDAVEIFGRHMESVRKDERVHVGDPSCAPFDLIKAGLFVDGIQSDSRYLLLLTENYEALGILQEQILQKPGVQTIFGSSFPRDQEYTKVCRNINRIKVCMETGQTVILLNLENLYESLYDALNQYYAKYGGERYVDLGLGSHRVKCRVHKNFRLIVVAEKTTVYDKFPIPLINRLEKHFLTQNTIMSEDQAKMSEKLKKWAEQLVNRSTPYRFNATDKHTVSVEDAFMGYHSDAAASIVMKVWTDKSTEEDEMTFIECKKALLWCCSPEIILQTENSQLCAEKEFIQTTYFEHQQHADIFSYVNVNLKNRTTPMFVQITTHSTLLAEDEKRGFTHDTCLLHLQSFDTEQQFCKEIRTFSEKAEDETRILIIQSDSQIGNRSLVKCAQYCVDDNLPKDLVNFHVIFIIQLNRISQQPFTGYQAGKWHCLHIDDLHPTKDIGATLMQMQNLSMADLFRRNDYNCLEISEEESKTSDDIQPEEKTSPVFTDQYIMSQITARVQAAVGKVIDDKNLSHRPAQRVSILLCLFNDTEGEFSQGIILSISHLIKQKEDTRGRDYAAKWLAREACKPDNINKAGTFRRAWFQCLEEKITSILAGIIAHIDKNLNLNIIDESTDWKKSVWLNILNKPSVCGLKYTDLISTEKMAELKEFVVRNTGYGRQSFQSRFPFSWLFYELTETALHTSVVQDPNLTGEEIVKHTVHVIEKRELFKILDRFVVDKEEVFSSYMNDFIVMTYGSKDTDIFKILYDILSSALTQRGFHLDDMDISSIIAAVHYIHTIAQYRIQHFLEIIHLKPDVVREIVAMKAKNTGHCLSNRNYMTVDVLGLCAFMEMMKPQTGKLDNPDGRRDWYKEACRCLPVAEKILDFSSSTTTVKGLEYHDACRDQLSQIRCLWTKIVTITLFIEHFSPTEESTADLYQSLKWQILWNLLKEDVDLHNLDSLERVEKFLKLINRAVLHKLFGDVTPCAQCKTTFESAPVELPCGDKICTECMVDIQEDGEKHCKQCDREIPDNFNAAASNWKNWSQLKTFHRSCDSFLMAMVSKLCFSANTAPSEAVVHRLMEYITVKKTTKTLINRVKTKPMSLFIHDIDRTPICRLFFLKLLIRQSAEYTSSYLHEFFEDAKQLIEQTSRRTKDVYYENASDFTDQCPQEIDVATTSLEAAAKYFRQTDKEEISVIKQLESLVRCRYGLVVAAKYLHHFFVLKNLNMSKKFSSLIEAIRNVILIETTMMWPKMFLLKQVCRQYGTECYEEIISNEEYKWIGLERKGEIVPDRYVIYGSDYTNIRQAVRLVDLGDDIQTLHKSLKKINNNRQEYMFLMVLQNAVSTYENKKTKQKLEEFIKSSDKFQLKNVALEFVSTTEDQRNPYIAVTTSNHSESINLESLLHHWLLVLNSSTDGFLQPLYQLLVDLSSMQEMFLPTMPEETLADISMVIKAIRTDYDQLTVYRCPNGHAYLIGECGKPWTVGRCNQCNAEIGGENHKAVEGNTKDDGLDGSKTGHILGSAVQRPLEATPERSMSPSVCAIIRMMTHMTMMLGAKQNPEGVGKLVNPPIEQNVEVYFTSHLQKDVAVLQKCLQKSSDDVYLLIHLICQHLLYNLPTGGEMNLLDSKESRRTWEGELSAVISQILQNMEAKLAKANQTIVENSSSDNCNLLKIMYEVDSSDEDMGLQNLETNPILWRYRERITVEHFLRQFQLKVIDQEDKDGAQTFQLIRLFMQEKYCLQVLQFLPDIIKLQHTLMMTFCRQVDRSEAQHLTIGTVLNEYFHGNVAIVLQFENLIRTWETIKEKLISHVCHLKDRGRLVIPEEFRNMKMDKSTKLDFILPSVKGPGVCSYIMTEYLLRKHNSCLESYCLLTNQRFEDVPVVEIKDISSYHLIAFHLEKDILPLVLSNCNYSFQLDKSRPEETYDFAGFENQLRDTAFTRKSRIKTEGHIIPIDTMLFKADSSNAVVFSALRHKIPQVSMKLVLKHQLSEEIPMLPAICDSLNNLDIANSFLKSLGGDPEASLHQFMSDTLKMKTTIFSQTARNECQFKHLQCLWLTLSFEKDKRLAAGNKESFVDLDDEVKKEIEDSDAEYFREKYQQYSVDKLNVLLHVIYDSILLRIAQTTDPEDGVDCREMRLSYILMGELESPPYTEPPTELQQLNIEMFNDWPENISGSQAIQVWKLLLEVYMKREREL